MTPKDTTALEARIEAGGGAGWVLPEDFDWIAHHDEYVWVIEDMEAFPALSCVLVDDHSGHVAIHLLRTVVSPHNVLLARHISVPSHDALDAMRQLSALRKDGE